MASSSRSRLIPPDVCSRMRELSCIAELRHVTRGLTLLVRAGYPFQIFGRNDSERHPREGIRPAGGRRQSDLLPGKHGTSPEAARCRFPCDAAARLRRVVKTQDDSALSAARSTRGDRFRRCAPPRSLGWALSGTSSWSPPDASNRAFSGSLTTTVFSQRSIRWFDALPRRTTPKGQQASISSTAPPMKIAYINPPSTFVTHGRRNIGVVCGV